MLDKAQALSDESSLPPMAGLRAGQVEGRPALTPYHAKYFAYELTKQSPSDSIQKLAATLVDAQVDLNPHQVEAALFAFRSPLSKGAILADEVGLGKTIEAGLVLSQKWAELQARFAVHSPARGEELGVCADPAWGGAGEYGAGGVGGEVWELVTGNSRRRCRF